MADESSTGKLSTTEGKRMNEVVRYEASYNKQIAEFSPELAKELKADVSMVKECALVGMDQGRILCASYLSYGGKFTGKKGDRVMPGAQLPGRENGSGNVSLGGVIAFRQRAIRG